MRNKLLSYVFLSSALLAQSVLLGVSPVNSYAQEVGTASEPFITISAVQITGGAGKTHEDFIELFNPSDQPFDLNGHRLVKRTANGTTDTLIKDWSSETVILPHHFYLWGNSNFISIPVAVDASSSATLADNNGIALRYGENNAGEVVDSIGWGSTANGFDNVSPQNPAANESLVQIDVLQTESDFTIRASDPRNSNDIFDLPVPTPSPTPIVTPTPESSPSPSPTPTNIPTPTPVIDESDENDNESEGELEDIKLKITEILPNPSGSDTGFEQIEIYNAGSKTISLKNYIIDDVSSKQPLSTNAYVVPDLTIPANAYLAIAIPAGKLSLNNTGGDVLTLFNSQKDIVDTILYEETAPEGESYSLFGSTWHWTSPTFGKSNGSAPVETAEDKENENEEVDNTPAEDPYDNSGIKITEIFPQPQSDAEEFVEIYNAGSETAQLSHIEIYIGERKKQLPEHQLQPGEYYIINQNDLPVQLRNSGQIVKLLEDQTELSTVTYPLAIENASFAEFEDGFLWTKQVTRNELNVLQIPEIIKKEVAQVASKTVVKKAATTVPKPNAAKSTSLKSAVSQFATTKPTPTISQSKNEHANPENPELIESSNKEQQESMGKIIAMGAAAVAAGVVALYKLVFTA